MLLQMSKTAFVEDAARAAARKVVARADVTLMDAEVFDTMLSAPVGAPPDAAAVCSCSRGWWP
jgi:uncharacterized protein (DUF1778 family)